MKENMFYGAHPIIFQRAEELRRNMTLSEQIIWNTIHINEWHVKFRRQHPIANYIADFYCHALKLVVEIDGEIHSMEEVKLMDRAREEHLKELGLHVLRVKNEDVFNDKKKVLQKIGDTINKLSSKNKNSLLNSSSQDGGKNTSNEKLIIIKIGGNIIDDESKLTSFLKDFSAIKESKILVHGGGKIATMLAEQLGVPQKMIEGRRITDAETLKLITMVYGGHINKNIVAGLQANNCNAIGVTGADGNIVLAHKRFIHSPLGHGDIDYGFVGDIDRIDTDLLQLFLNNKIFPVIAPLTHDKNGQLLNTNADTIAQKIASALSNIYDVSLIYSFEKNGVLADTDDDNSVIKKIDADLYSELKGNGTVFKGMIPKLDNAFAAINSGVKKVIIGKAETIHQLLNGEAGTTIVNK